MNIAAEKEEIIRRLNEVQDVSLIKAFKNLLDFGLGKQKVNAHDEALEEALGIAIKQSDNREVRPHEEVWSEIRNKYKE